MSFLYSVEIAACSDQSPYRLGNTSLYYLNHLNMNPKLFLHIDFAWLSLGSPSVICTQNLSTLVHPRVLLVFALSNSNRCSYSARWLCHELNETPKKQKMIFDISAVLCVCMFCRRYTDYFVPYFSNCLMIYGPNYSVYRGQNAIKSRVNAQCTSIFVRITTVLSDILTEVLT